jgi:predicted signal transduction protein with EAL and GGDEF domain
MKCRTKSLINNLLLIDFRQPNYWQHDVSSSLNCQIMELVKFNLNYNVRVRIKDKGIEHYVRKYNEIMPFHLHTSFKEFKQKADADGYHTMQMHSFMDDFGCMGLSLADLVDTNIYLFQKDVEPVEGVQ